MGYPNCKSNKRQVKNGFNKSGSQKYVCRACATVYTPEAKGNGYPVETRWLAIRMYVECNSYGAIGRIWMFNPQSVANWVKVYTAKLPNAPLPEKVKKAELDELYTFVGQKKTKSTS